MFGKKLVILCGTLLLIGLIIYFFSGLPKPGVLSTQTKTSRIILVGDSMTQLLGTGLPELRETLAKYYPKKVFDIYNYAQGSTNVLTIKDRLEKETQSLTGDIYPPILQQDFDLIIIESFGHNPLSQYPLEEGLKIQNQTLDEAIKKIKTSHPKAIMVFLATIAPNRDRYAENTINLMPEQRHQWADERTAYIKNHIEYAKSHHIPLINVYEKSLKDGTGNIDYINTTDFIHPSPTGIYLISQEIADFTHQNKLIK